MKDKNENVKAIMDMILEYGLEVEYHTTHSCGSGWTYREYTGDKILADIRNKLEVM